MICNWRNTTTFRTMLFTNPKIKIRITHILVTFAMSMLFGCGGNSVTPNNAPNGEQDLDSRLPKEIQTAWQNAGAKIAFFRLDRIYAHFDEIKHVLASHASVAGMPKPANTGDAILGEIPVFAFYGLDNLENKKKVALANGTLAKLPYPGKPFALDLSYVVDNKQHLNDLAKYNKNLQFLDVSDGVRLLRKRADNGVADIDLKMLLPLTNLRYLDLSSTQLTDGGLKTLAHFKDLSALALSNTAVTDKGFKDLVKLKKLQLLNLSGSQVTDVGLKQVALLEGLESLNLTQTRVTEIGLEHLTALKNLRTLQPNRVNSQTFAALRKLNLLHTLPQAAAKNGTRPKGPDDVTSLDLRMVQVGGRDLKELAIFKNVETVDIRAPGYPAKYLKLLKPLKKLRTLYIDIVRDADLRELGKVNQLHSLSQVIAKDGKRPTGADDVISMDLRKTYITDEGLKELSIFSHLRKLYLNDRIGADLNELRKKFPGCEFVR